MPKRVDRDTELVLVNNTKGGFRYNVPGGVSIAMNEYGDTAFVNHGEISKMINGGSRSRKMFEKLDIVIQEVLDSDEVTLKDVIDELRLTKSYEALLSLNDEKLDNDTGFIELDGIDIFLLEADVKDIEKIMNDKKNKLRKTLAEHAAALHKTDDFQDWSKMEAIAIGLGQGERNVQNFWRDIRESARYQDMY